MLTKRICFVLYSLVFLSFSVTLLALSSFHIDQIVYYNDDALTYFNHSIKADPIAVSAVILISLQLPWILTSYFVYFIADHNRHFPLHYKFFLAPASITLTLCICLLFTKSPHWNCTNIYRRERYCMDTPCNKKRDTLCKWCDITYICLQDGLEDITRIDYITYTTIGVILLGLAFGLFPCSDHLSTQLNILKEERELREIVKDSQRESFHHFYTKLRLFDFIQSKLGKDVAKLIYYYLKIEERDIYGNWSFSKDLGYVDENDVNYLIYLKVKQKCIKGDEVIDMRNMLD